VTILVVSGTRGAGKTTVANRLVPTAGARLIPAVTTRPPRADDLPGNYEYTDVASLAAQCFILCTSYGAHSYAVRGDDVLAAVTTHAWRW
jgi:deoxyadenosine/deoxycytidine kinase